MLKIPSELFYAETHEWAQKGGDSVVCGLTHHAQEQLGDIVYVDLPEVDVPVTKGDEICVIESVKAAADYYAPVTGTIIEVNSQIKENPALLNEDPYGGAWLVKIVPDDEKELTELLDSEE